MDNAKLIKLVRFGLRNFLQAAPLEAAVENIVEVIELELAIEADERDGEGPIEVPRPVPKVEPGLPPPMGAITAAPLVPDDSSPFETARPLSAAELTTPVAHAAPSSILLATETDMDAEIAKASQAQIAAQRPRIRLHSISGGNSRRLNLDAAQKAIESVMPEWIDIQADGRPALIRLFRSTSQLPSSGKRNDPNDMIKVCYLASGVAKEMETQVLVTVAQAQDGIDPGLILATIRKNAFSIYRPRPAVLTPRMPPMPTESINVQIEEGTQQGQSVFYESIKKGTQRDTLVALNPDAKLP